MNARDPQLPVQPDEASALADYAQRHWDEQIVPALTDYIGIPAKSPMFDADWQAHGYLERVVRDTASWIEGRKVPGLRLEVLRQEGRTPLIFFDIPATRAQRRRDRGLLRPSGQAARVQRLAPRPRSVDAEVRERQALRPRRRRRRLCGLCRDHRDRGAGRTGHIAAALRRPDRDLRRKRLGRPAGLPGRAARAFGPRGLVVCLDSGAGSYDQLWLTTSLRGMVSGVLKVEVLGEGIHSGDASGVVPSSFRILRHLLDRLEDSSSGELLPQSFHCAVPAQRIEQARATAAILKDEVYKRFPWACGADGGAVLPTTTDPVQVLLNRTWRPTLSVTGVEGFPELGNAGNVLRPYTAFKLSLRLPPLVDGHEASVQAEDAARRQRALQRQGQLPPGRPRRPPGRHRLERTGAVALAGAGAECRVDTATSARRWATSDRAARSR